MIRETQDGEAASVLVLGRYVSSRRALGGRRDSRAGNVEFSTVHSAKGREADYVIVLDLRDGRYGFPCRVEDDPLLEIVLPPVHGRGYPYAEERRLFYVALTRARRGTYLVADPNRPSPFVRELLKHSPEISRIVQVGGLVTKSVNTALPNYERARLLHLMAKSLSLSPSVEKLEPLPSFPRGG